ncbi:type 1 glutamine amidotransferase family protein [Maribacter forsetii]|uniref:membrane protein n=1 Tax=Maribacter forsetii TaxID=444515 RepID=UPI0005641FC1|nr:membrane protein [Maribacter forsetii]
MKKVVLIVVVLLLIFLGLTYLSLSSTDKTFDTCEIIGAADVNEIDFKKYDSVIVAASTLYEGNNLKNVMQGEQYRKAWSTPVSVPILYLNDISGSVKVLEEGGGKQTHSLKLQKDDGTLMTLRSVSKDPSPLVPKVAKTLGIENIVVDGISAQHPYAALVVAKLSEKAKILNTKPKLVFVPKQEQLSDYNIKYGNRLFLLEYETKGNANWLNIKNVDSLMDTDDLQELKIKYPTRVSINASSLVRARLFDLLIGDWDRHAKQWGWAIEHVGDSINVIPLPCDRDNAFFNLEGVLPTIISNNAFLPEVQSFEKEIDFLSGLISPFDIYFMRDIPQSVFEEEAKKLQQLLTDEAIASSFSVWPDEIYKLDGKELITKIKSRRDHLVAYAILFQQDLVESEALTKSLKGSEDVKMTEAQMTCFNCIGE